MPHLFTGRRYDFEVKLYYYRARYYSATLGRFLQTDPIGYDDQMNLYAYVDNDPLNGADPSGMTQSCEGAKDASSSVKCFEDFDPKETTVKHVRSLEEAAEILFPDKSEEWRAGWVTEAKVQLLKAQALSEGAERMPSMDEGLDQGAYIYYSESRGFYRRRQEPNTRAGEGRAPRDHPASRAHGSGGRLKHFEGGQIPGAGMPKTATSLVIHMTEATRGRSDLLIARAKTLADYQHISFKTQRPVILQVPDVRGYFVFRPGYDPSGSPIKYD